MPSKSGIDLVYFFHIPKTAGTSLHHYLGSFFQPDEITPPLLWDDLVSGRVRVTERTRLVSGHFGGLLPLWLGRWPTMVTILREPVARSLSHINHIQRAPSHPHYELAVGKSIEEYCENPILRRTIADFQARYLASLAMSSALLPRDGSTVHGSISVGFEDALFSLDSEEGLVASAKAALEQFAAVGICESYGRSERLFGRVLGQTRMSSQTPVLNRAGSDQKSVRDLTHAERECLEDLTQIDASVYRYGQLIFERQCRAHGVTEPVEYASRAA